MDISLNEQIIFPNLDFPQLDLQQQQQPNYITKNIHILEAKSNTTIRFNQMKIHVDDDYIELQPLIKILKEQIKYILSDGFLIYVYNDLKAEYVYMGTDPLLFPVCLPIAEFRNSQTIFLKFHSENISKKRIKRQMKNEKRFKERGIQKVMELVEEWRKIHREEQGKLNLEQIAQNMNISRKTLDDYSLQLRKAQQLGFDFQANKHQKMGILRSFVRLNQKDQSIIKRKILPKTIELQKQELEFQIIQEKDYAKKQQKIEEDLDGQMIYQFNTPKNQWKTLGPSFSTNYSDETGIQEEFLENNIDMFFQQYSDEQEYDSGIFNYHKKAFSSLAQEYDSEMFVVEQQKALQ